MQFFYVILLRRCMRHATSKICPKNPTDVIWTLQYSRTYHGCLCGKNAYNGDDVDKNPFAVYNDFLAVFFGQDGHVPCYESHTGQNMFVHTFHDYFPFFLAGVR